MRRIGVLMYWTADDAEGQARLAAFTAGRLQQSGWSEGRNLRIDTRWATADDIRRHAAELVALAPDVTRGRDWHRNRGVVAAGDPHRADRVRDRHRPGRRRFRRKPWHGRAATPLGSRFTNTA